MTDKDYKKQILALLSELSDERIEWLKDVAWNLARVTRKYDRISVCDGLSLKEKILLLDFEAEESKKWIEEMEIEHEEFMRKQIELDRETEKFIRETDEFIRSLKRDRASSFINYPFFIGEA
jgi:hypothetical protein